MKELPTTIDPKEWHRRPKGWTKACPICGCPAKYPGEHRAGSQAEGHTRKWLRRVQAGIQWTVTEVGDPFEKPKQIIRTDVRGKIAEAARMYARGKTLQAIARLLKVNPGTLDQWRKNYPVIWRHDFRQTMEEVIAEEAAKPPIDESEFREAGENVLQLAPLPTTLEEKQRMPLLAFLHAVYIPSRLELSAGAVSQIEVAIRQLERWAGRQLVVFDFSEDLVRRFLADFRVDRSAATTNGRRRDLLALWQCAFDEEYLDRQPRRNKVPRAKARPKVPTAWTVQQVAAILQASQADQVPIGGLPAADWWKALILVLYDSAARLGECLQVAPRDLSIAERWILFRLTKNGVERLAAIHEETAAACAVIFNPGREFVWPLGISRQQLDRRFGKILDRAGIPPTPGRLFRRFRITSGSLVAAAGGNGARHLGNGEAVFRKHYCDPRVLPREGLDHLPRPEVPLLLTFDDQGA